MDEQSVLEILRQSLEDIRGKGGKGPAFSPEMQITGKDGALDSLDTMLFLDRAEERVRAAAGWDVPLVGDGVLNANPSPFATMRTMAAYILGLLAVIEDR
jgi:hypothetical protein